MKTLTRLYSHRIWCSWDKMRKFLKLKFLRHHFLTALCSDTKNQLMSVTETQQKQLKSKLFVLSVYDLQFLWLNKVFLLLCTLIRRIIISLEIRTTFRNHDRWCQTLFQQSDAKVSSPSIWLFCFSGKLIFHVCNSLQGSRFAIGFSYRPWWHSIDTCGQWRCTRTGNETVVSINIHHGHRPIEQTRTG